MDIIKILFRPLYRFLLSIKMNVLKFKELRAMRKYGIEALSEFDKCMRSNGYTYCLAFGTLLGAVREKDFIPYDEDIDVCMFSSSFSENLIIELEKCGFKRQHTYLVDDGKLGREDSFRYKGVQIDIFYIYDPIDNYPYYCDFVCFADANSISKSVKKYGGLLPRRIQLPFNENITYIDFHGLSLPIPVNYSDILSFRYGSDYMVPKKRWNNTSNPNISYWYDKIGVYKKI